MAEAYIVRRGGKGSGSNIFLQTAQPSYSKGGLWVNTSLSKYSFDVFTTPAVTVIPSDISNIPSSKGIYKPFILYNGVIYIGTNANSSLSGARGYIDTNTWADWGWPAGSNKSYGVDLLVPYNNKIYYWFSLSSGIKYAVFDIASQSYNRYSDSGTISIINNGGFVYDELGFAYGFSTDNLYKLSVTSNSKTIFAKLPIGTLITCSIVDRNIYAFNGYSNVQSHKSYKINADTGIYSEITDPSTLYIRPVGHFGGNIYFIGGDNTSSRTIYAYSISSNTYTKNMGAVQNDNNCEMIYKNKAYITSERSINCVSLSGNPISTDTIYIVPGTTNNIARIFSDKNGNCDIPIQGVYSVQSGQLKPVTASVSTGSAWKTVVY